MWKLPSNSSDSPHTYGLSRHGGFARTSLAGAYISDAPQDTGISFLGEEGYEDPAHTLGMLPWNGIRCVATQITGSQDAATTLGGFPQVTAQAGGGGVSGAAQQAVLTTTGTQGTPIALGICSTRCRTGRGEVSSAAQPSALTSTDDNTSQGSSISWSSKGTNYPANWRYYLAHDNSDANSSNSNSQGWSIATSALADTHRGA